MNRLLLSIIIVVIVLIGIVIGVILYIHNKRKKEKLILNIENEKIVLDNDDKWKEEIMPKVIHVVWVNPKENGIENTIPKNYSRLLDDCKKLNSDWEYKLWRDSDVSKFMKENYSDMLPFYNNYKTWIERHDFFRYLLIYKLGGLYMDMDMFCLKKLSNLIKNYKGVAYFAAFRTDPQSQFYIGNDFLGGSPKHPVYKYIIMCAKYYQKKNISTSFLAFYTTGPIFLTKVLRYYYDPNQFTVFKMPLIHNKGEGTGDPNMYCSQYESTEICRKKFPNSYTTSFLGGVWSPGNEYFFQYLKELWREYNFLLS